MMNFEIGELHPNTPHLFADLAELLLLTQYNGRKKLHVNDLESLLATSPINSDEIDEEIDENKRQKSSAERNSRGQQQIEDVMMLIEYRCGAFGNWYPFQIDGDFLHISRELTNRQRIYRALVACSRLRSFQGKGVAQRWAKTFTQVSRFAMQSLAPSAAVSRIFDANSDDRVQYYGTDLREALQKMGKDLGVLRINEEECNKVSSSGDAGFDLISNLHFEDGAASNYAILGQCGAQETGWPKKTLESHALNCRNFFQMQFDYPNVMFIPISFRTATGEWVDNKSANGTLLLDRLRILKLIEHQPKSEQIVNEAYFENFEHEFSEYNSIN